MSEADDNFDPRACDDAFRLSREVRAALGSGDATRVEDALWRLIEIDPHPERAQMLLALRLVQQGRYEDSLRQIEEASAKLVLSLRSAMDVPEPDQTFVDAAFQEPAAPHRLWRLTDARGSWVTLEADTMASVRRWSHMEQVGTYPTYVEAVRALWAAQRELRDSGRDRRKDAGRGQALPVPHDRRALPLAEATLAVEERMRSRGWIAAGAATLPDPVVHVTRVVEEYRIWLWSDHRGSWVVLHENPFPSRAGGHPVGLWGSYPTREEALRALWEAGQELRADGIDRRKEVRRRHSRESPDRRTLLDDGVWTALE